MSPEPELQRLVDEQTALRRVATLVASGVSQSDLVAAVTSEIARLFDADTASTLRWDGDTIRVIGDWSTPGTRPSFAGQEFAFGGDTITARVVDSGGPSRIDAVGDLETEFARARWTELGLEASIGAPIVVDGRVWGIVMASRTRPDPFPPGAEHRLGDFAALVAQAIANAEARREVASLAEEQAALRRGATPVAPGKPQQDVLDAVTRGVAQLFEADAVNLVRWQGVPDEVVVLGGWSGARKSSIPPASLYHPSPGGATLRVLETGFPSRSEERSPE